MIDPFLLLEILKWLLIGFELVRYFIHRKREKTLVAEIESINQRLNSLEKSVKELKP